MVQRRSPETSFVELGDLTNARDSIQNIKKVSHDSIYDFYDVDPEKFYRLSYIRKQFQLKGLDDLFDRYTERIDQTYFSSFLILQTALSITHFLLVLILNVKSKTVDIIVPDLTLYSVTGVLSIIIFCINERYLRNKHYMLKYFSFLIFGLIYITNLFIPTYYHLSKIYMQLRPAYIIHISIVIYCFIGTMRDVYVLLLGTTVSVSHLLFLAFVTYNSENIWEKLGSDIVFLVCLNCLGMFHRWANELIKRRAFLDHRAYVESTLKLNFEKEQEEQLMTSIIPKHTIDKVRKDILHKIEILERMENLPEVEPMSIPFVQEYDNVTILYADIVNYTAMTTQLPVIELVDTLNELFSGFDDASEELNVMRIKFLGDCYYSVAGLPPNPAPNHAEACVDLGLRMISIIRSVRESRNLAIDMRIGIHSGRILSGLIGSTKWQFDIWSKDVYIANKMETAGEPGKIHITQQTYDLLKKNTYKITRSDRGNTSPHLKDYGVQTYFITPDAPTPLSDTQSELIPVNENKRRSVLGNGIILNGISRNTSTPNFHDQPIQSNLYEQRRESLRNVQTPIGNIIQRRPSGHTVLAKRRITPSDIKRRTAFMDNNIKKYKMLLAKTQENIKTAIENMPLSKYDQWLTVKEINPLFLMFKSWKMEKKYIQLSDKLFRYYLIVYVLLLIATFIVQNLNLPQWKWHLWSYYGTIILILFILIPLTWLHSLWNEHVGNHREENDPQPKNTILKSLYVLSKYITTNSLVRTTIYIVTCSLFFYCVLEDITECTDGSSNTNMKSIMQMLARKGPDEECVIPWHLSHTISLTILVGFYFIRIHVWLKLLFALMVTSIYGVLIWNYNYKYYGDSETFNYMMSPQIADIMSLAFLTFSLHLLDRQSDYLSRLDFQWTEKLVVEQIQVNTMNKITKLLLQNILPAHVAQLYLDVNRKNNNVYNEEHENAAVIFASLIDLPMDVSEEYFLMTVNRIIKDFDLLLRKERQNPIEKIKVSNLTYMAACGLDSGTTDGLPDEDSKEHIVVTLMKFATDLIKALKQINNETSQKCQLRIGISHGKVLGGVVGSKKPLYDIWSDTVNMASRMDTTGTPGKIQVTQNTARVLKENGIEHEFRGFTFVKGKNKKIPTYFVSLDDHDNLISFDVKNTTML